ncbi:MAG: hypothetical protein A2583_13235, partial [Bdellovibrionales bacterium RIFOXYD1_FULL_53_11]
MSTTKWKLRLGFVFLALSAFSGIVACTKKNEGASSRVVNLAIWSNYLSPETIGLFQKKTGITVRVSNFSSNEELLAKLQAGASGYDVVVPSDYMVFAMSKLGLLRGLDRGKLANFSQLDGKLLDKPYDPGNRFSVPYDWGTTGIAVNRTLYRGRLTGWKDVFGNPALKGKYTLLDDVRETLGAALRSLGLGQNSIKPEDLEKAKRVLMAVRTEVKGFTSEPMAPLASGETAVAHAYMSDALQASRSSGGKIEYIIPEEGATFWIDNLVIPAGAANVEQAHALIDFMLDAGSNLATVKSVLVAPANKNVFKILPPELQANKALFPSDDVMKRMEMIQDIGEALAVWDRIWTEIKAG